MAMTDHRRGFALARDLIGFQLRLLLDAARDLVLIPLSLFAAGLDLALLKRQEPRYFRGLLEFGQRSARQIDLWSTVYDRHAQPENVDAVLTQIEQAVRDPAAGARRARVLKRWAERQLRRRSSAVRESG